MCKSSLLVAGRRGRGQHNIAERLLQGLGRVMAHALQAEELGQRRGVLQGLDPRFKLLCMLLLIASVVATHSLWVLGLLFVLALLLARLSRVSVRRLWRQVWLGVLLFTGGIALPAIFLVPGDALAQLPVLHWTISLNGVRSAAFLIGRAQTSATLALLLVLTTPWAQLLKALRCLRVPLVLVAILGMTQRYIFVLMLSSTQLLEARRSRMLAPLTPSQQRKLVVTTAGVLLSRSIQLSTEVHLAMLSRGYRGEVHLLDTFHSRIRDWLALAATLALAITLFWMPS